MTREEITTAIRTQRKALSISQAQLSELTSITREYIPAIEKNKQNITIDKLITICNALNLTITITKA